MPLPTVVVDLTDVVGVTPIISMQTKSPKSKNSHDEPTAGFQASTSATETPAARATAAQVFPPTTKRKLLQFVTMPV